MRKVLITLPSETTTDTHCGDCFRVHSRGPGSGWVIAQCAHFGTVQLDREDDMRSARRHSQCIRGEHAYAGTTPAECKSCGRLAHPGVEHDDCEGYDA